MVMLTTAVALSLAETANDIKLYPSDAKPRKNTASLMSTKQRVGNVVYQVFHPRDDPSREAFRVDIGSYEKGQLVEDWTYGIIVEKDMNGDGIQDYVWYGGDDTGQRLLWFISKDRYYDCINVLKSAQAAWMKKFGKAAPDLGVVFGDKMVDDVRWDGHTQLLIVTVVPNDSEEGKTHGWKLTVTPSEFVHSKR
jgi:hypothetical protein